MSSNFCTNCQPFAIQDTTGLVRNLYLVLTNQQVRSQLQLNARQTAEQFRPVAIAERWVKIEYTDFVPPAAKVHIITLCTPEMLLVL